MDIRFEGRVVLLNAQSATIYWESALRTLVAKQAAYGDNLRILVCAESVLLSYIQRQALGHALQTGKVAVISNAALTHATVAALRWKGYDITSYSVKDAFAALTALDLTLDEHGWLLSQHVPGYVPHPSAVA